MTHDVISHIIFLFFEQSFHGGHHVEIWSHIPNYPSRYFGRSTSLRQFLCPVLLVAEDLKCATTSSPVCGTGLLLPTSYLPQINKMCPTEHVKKTFHCYSNKTFQI